MNELWNCFEKDRKNLDEQYLNAWENGASFDRVEVLRAKVIELANTLEGEPHPVIKAKCFDYILEHAPIYINPIDWFGIALEAQQIVEHRDIGCKYRQIMTVLSDKWKKELTPKLNLPENKHFAQNTRGVLFNEFYIDYNHSTPSWNDIFELGLCGIIERAEKYRTDKDPAYFDGIAITYNAIIKLFKRYIAALEGYSEPKMQYMKKAFENLLTAPPKNTYEAMLLSWQFWYLEENVDGVRARTMGGLDDLYFPFYQKDIANGTFTKENIKELFVYFMGAFNSFRVRYQQPMYLGGMDEDGNCIVNELSYVALDAYNILAAPNPKLQVKISLNTPDDFLKATLITIRNGNTSISIINDDNAAASLMKLGVPKNEALTSLMSGCWDYAVKDHEVKTVPIRVSLPKIVEYTLLGGRDMITGALVCEETDTNFESFDDFYATYKKHWLYIWKRAKAIVENWELYLADLCPSNMFSATMTDSLSRAIDGYANGMKYNNTVYCCACLASTIDALCAIKKYVFDKKEVTIKELTDILKNNWEGSEKLRRTILNDSDKYGNGSALADEIMVDLTDFIANNVNGVPNSRGGYWKCGILSIDKNVRFGSLTSATPDGRLYGEPFSKNLSSVVGMDKNGITTFLRSVSKIDATKLPHSGMVDVILHPTAVSGDDGLEAFFGIVKGYFAMGGHSIQFNIFSAQTLKDAQKNPDKYRTLQVRVCGWNVYFVDLEKVLQDAFIAQCENTEAVGR